MCKVLTEMWRETEKILEQREMFILDDKQLLTTLTDKRLLQISAYHDRHTHASDLLSLLIRSYQVFSTTLPRYQHFNTIINCLCIINSDFLG